MVRKFHDCRVAYANVFTDFAVEMLLDDPHLDKSMAELCKNRPRRSASLGMDCSNSQADEYRLPRLRRRRRTLSRELVRPRMSPSLLRKRLGDTETDDMIAARRMEEWSRRTRDSSFPSHAILAWGGQTGQSTTSSPKCRKRGEETLYSPELVCHCIGGIVAAHTVQNSRQPPSPRASPVPSRRQQLCRVFDATAATSTAETINVIGFGEGECRVSLSLLILVLFLTGDACVSATEYCPHRSPPATVCAHSASLCARSIPCFSHGRRVPAHRSAVY